MTVSGRTCSRSTNSEIGQPIAFRVSDNSGPVIGHECRLLGPGCHATVGLPARNAGPVAGADACRAYPGQFPMTDSIDNSGGFGGGADYGSFGGSVEAIGGIGGSRRRRAGNRWQDAAPLV